MDKARLKNQRFTSNFAQRFKYAKKSFISNQNAKCVKSDETDPIILMIQKILKSKSALSMRSNRIWSIIITIKDAARTEKYRPLYRADVDNQWNLKSP